MNFIEIGENCFFYSTDKSLYHIIAKRFYSDHKHLFNDVLINENQDKSFAVGITMAYSKEKIYFNMSPEKNDEWFKIIKRLKNHYNNYYPVLFDIPINLINENNNIDLINNLKEKLNKKKSNSIIKKLLYYAPIDENGKSKLTYFKDINLNSENIGLIPNNGVQWKREAEKYFIVYTEKERQKTIAFQFMGWNIENETKNKQINPNIRKYLEKLECSHCNSPNKQHKKHDIDHKNGRYNDKNALNFDTQQIGDFQVLCREHNELKRDICKKCIETGKRFDAMYLGYSVSIIEGSIEYDEEFGCVGCYWYDCIKFKSKLHL